MTEYEKYLAKLRDDEIANKNNQLIQTENTFKTNEKQTLAEKQRLLAEENARLQLTLRDMPAQLQRSGYSGTGRAETAIGNVYSGSSQNTGNIERQVNNTLETNRNSLNNARLQNQQDIASINNNYSANVMKYQMELAKQARQAAIKQQEEYNKNLKKQQEADYAAKQYYFANKNRALAQIEELIPSSSRTGYEYSSSLPPSESNSYTGNVRVQGTTPAVANNFLETMYYTYYDKSPQLFEDVVKEALRTGKITSSQYDQWRADSGL